MVNGSLIRKFDINKGYIKLNRKWNKGDEITLELEMPIEIVKSSYKIKQNEGKAAIQRGPIIYCVEEVDNEKIDKLKITDNMRFYGVYKEELLNGCVQIIGKDENEEIYAIPYYAWDNRKEGKMKVWIPIENKEERPYTVL